MKQEKEQIDQYLKEINGSQKAEALQQNTASVKTVVKTIHFITENETGNIGDILIEIINSRSGKLLYLTVPMDLKVALSTPVYDRLNTSAVMVPQMFKLSMLSAYFTGEKQVEAARLILEDTLGVQMDYYSVVSREVFEQRFEKAADGTYHCMEVKAGGLQNISQLFENKEAIREIYLNYETDFSYQERMIYLETYQALKKEDYVFEKVSGKQMNDAFILDEKENKAKILMFCAGQA